MATLAYYLINLIILAIFGRVILDWLVIGRVMQPQNPIRYALITITEPLLAPIRRYVSFGGIDLSPMVVIFILFFIQSAVLRSL